MSDSQQLTTGLDTPGKRIKFLRQSKDMTQTDLARAIFTTQPTVARWEADEFLPGKQSRVLIAELFDVSRTFIFGDPQGWAA